MEFASDDRGERVWPVDDHDVGCGDAQAVWDLVLRLPWTDVDVGLSYGPDECSAVLVTEDARR